MEQHISDPSPLADLTKLEWLDLRINNTSNLSFLAGLTNPIYLNLEANNAIVDISLISGLAYRPPGIYAFKASAIGMSCL